MYHYDMYTSVIQQQNRLIERIETTRRSKTDLNYYICGRVCRCLEQKCQRIYTTYSTFLMNISIDMYHSIPKKILIEQS